ncbi:MAG: F420-nonreducing hydrogenase [Nitrospirae bacterium]|nr:F420-nonreducing hydrogenase [Nitrospirota bacterium]
MMKKLRVATGHLQGCFGCHMALLDLHEDLIALLDSIDLVRSPINDVKSVPKVELGILDGALCNSSNLALAKEFRKKAGKILAFGTCAAFGGINGLRNLFSLEEVLGRAYVETESTIKGKVPSSPDIPGMLPHVRAVHQEIQVDYVLPGCPPTPRMIKAVLSDIIGNKEPDIPQKNLCHECNRKHKEMYIPKREFVTNSVHAIMELDEIDPEKCFLEQGLLCMGPATREGCEARCVKGNVPCRGCMGPTTGALEQGAKMINALASILPAGAMMFMEDVVGVGYRYSLPVSIFPYREDK